VVLEAVGHLARVCARIDLELVRDTVAVEGVVQLARVGLQSVLVPDVDRDRAIASQLADVLVHERERRVGGPPREHVRWGAPSFVGRSR
jgi:hypothetical protein